MSLQSGFSIPHEEEEEDRISDLPDSLLHHIISFLPIEDAGITRLISKRWKPLSFSQLIIYFDEKHCREALPYRQFLGAFIATRDNTLPILSFHLKCRHPRHSQNDINDFVYTAVQGGVENLTIDLCLYSKTTLPTFVLTTKP